MNQAASLQLDPSQAFKGLDSYQAGYGPYAFGTVSFLVLAITSAIVWSKMIAPRQQELANARVKAAEEFTRATENLKTTAATQERMQDSVKTIASLQAQQTQHLATIADRLAARADQSN